MSPPGTSETSQVRISRALRRSIIMGHLHDRLAGYLVLRRAGKVQEVSHGRIIETLRAHDVAAARQVMLDELNESRDAILERVMQEDGALWHIGAAK